MINCKDIHVGVCAVGACAGESPLPKRVIRRSVLSSACGGLLLFLLECKRQQKPESIFFFFTCSNADSDIKKTWMHPTHLQLSITEHLYNHHSLKLGTQD